MFDGRGAEIQGLGTCTQRESCLVLLLGVAAIVGRPEARLHPILILLLLFLSLELPNSRRGGLFVRDVASARLR